MEGLTGTHEEIIVDHITDAMKVMVPPKRRWRRACARVDAPSEARTLEECKPVGLWHRADPSFGSATFPDSAFRLRWAHKSPRNKGIFVRAFWAALVSPAGFHAPRLQARPYSRPAHRGTASRRYLRASSLQFSTTVALVSSVFVLLKAIPSEMRIWPLAVFSEFPESYSSPKASAFSTGPPDWLFTPKRNDNKTIYVGLAARRDRQFGGQRNTQALREPRIRRREAAVPFPQLLGVLLRRGLINKNKLRIESESFVRTLYCPRFRF